jgi:hypothetical protein
MSKTHVRSIGTGTLLLVVGLVLAFTTGGVETPVITLSKLGVVLAVIGGLEVVVSTVGLVRSR